MGTWPYFGTDLACQVAHMTFKVSYQFNLIDKIQNQI